MIDVLLYASINCSVSNDIISNIEKYQQNNGIYSNAEVKELIDVVKESTPECFNEGSE